MDDPSVKNVSTAQIEAALAQALQQLTGWEKCTVAVHGLDFERVSVGERVALRLQASFQATPSEGVGF